MWLAPNLITLLGLSALLLSYGVAAAHQPDFSGFAPLWVYVSRCGCSEGTPGGVALRWHIYLGVLQSVKAPTKNSCLCWGSTPAWLVPASRAAAPLCLLRVPSCCVGPPTPARSAFAVFFYLHMDNLDGKQARRTKNSSPLGQLFDHGEWPAEWLACLRLLQGWRVGMRAMRAARVAGMASGALRAQLSPAPPEVALSPPGRAPFSPFPHPPRLRRAGGAPHPHERRVLAQLRHRLAADGLLPVRHGALGAGTLGGVPHG